MIFDSPVYNSSEFFITAILIGSCVAVYYKRLTGVTPGGIVPIGASLILLIRNPIWAIFCFALSFLASRRTSSLSQGLTNGAASRMCIQSPLLHCFSGFV